MAWQVHISRLGVSWTKFRAASKPTTAHMVSGCGITTSTVLVSKVNFPSRLVTSASF